MSAAAYSRGIAQQRRTAPRRDRRRWRCKFAVYQPEAMLAAIPSLPRPMLERVVASMIDHLNALDGDWDAEDGDEDHCICGDDDIKADSLFGRGDGYPGDPDDAEDSYDRELTDEREPCPINGQGPILDYRQHVTA